MQQSVDIKSGNVDLCTNSVHVANTYPRPRAEAAWATMPNVVFCWHQNCRYHVVHFVPRKFIHGTDLESMSNEPWWACESSISSWLSPRNRKREVILHYETMSRMSRWIGYWARKWGHWLLSRWLAPARQAGGSADCGRWMAVRGRAGQEAYLATQAFNNIHSVVLPSLL